MRSPDDTRMSLGEHLGELRTRLIRALAAVLVLAVVGLVYSKDLYGLLMRPVLRALPAGSSALVYTSAVEELSVYLKVGLYAGLALATPVALWELWGFVAPGLHAHERRMALPFVLAGTLAFGLGTLFCYVLLLPPMFTFLLQDPGTARLEGSLSRAELRARVALDWLRAGEPARAESAAARAAGEVASARPSRPGTGVEARAPLPAAEARHLVEGLLGLSEAALSATPPQARAGVTSALELQALAVEALAAGELERAGAAADEAARQLGACLPEQAAAIARLWGLQHDLARARAGVEAARWTRPMLSMQAQLSLVLALEIATGVIFELPIVMTLLGLVGILSARTLLRYQRHAIVICVVVAAVVTPTGDPVNLALMTGPMLLCYELGVLSVWLVERRRARRLAPA